MHVRAVLTLLQSGRALFERPFERIPVDHESYLTRLIIYIHQNLHKHPFTADFRTWNYSSYQELMANRVTCLARDKVIQLFGSKEDDIRIHQEIPPLIDLEDKNQDWICQVSS